MTARRKHSNLQSSRQRMPNLQALVLLLDEMEQLARIKVAVDPHLEAAAIIDRACKGASPNKALLFEQITGSTMPLVANLFGSSQRMALAFGTDDLSLLSQRLRTELTQTGTTCADEGLRQLLTQAKHATVIQPRGLFQQCDSSAAGLELLPALQSWPQDGGRYLTLGQVFTHHPETGALNCGLYRLQIIDDNTALLRCHPGSGGAAHLQAWHERGEAMPVAIALGGPPALTWAAAAPLPVGVSESDFIAYLTQSPVSMTPCRHSALMVPAEAEIVVEGRIEPGEVGMEGPFGNHTGHYVPAAAAPLVRIEGLYHRERAIYPCTLVGPPPMENLHLAAATQQLLSPMLQHDQPWVKNLHIPAFGAFHRAALVAIDETAPTSLDEIGSRLWNSALLKNARLLILLDGDVEPQQFEQAYWRLVNAGDWSATTHISKNRLIIDARRNSALEKVVQDAEVSAKIERRWREFGLG